MKKYFEGKNNKDVLNQLKYELKKYHQRVDNIEKNLKSTGQSGATPQRYDIEELMNSITNKHQVNSLIGHMNKIYVNKLGDIVDGKYTEVIEGKMGAKILKVEDERLKRQTYYINMKKEKEAQSLKDRGLREKAYEYHKLNYNINDLQSSSLKLKKEVTFTRSLVPSFFDLQILNYRKNMVEATNNVFGSDGKILNRLLEELSDVELDTLSRTAGSKINIEYIYTGKQTEEHIEGLLFQYQTYLGKEKFDKIMKEIGGEKFINVNPKSISQANDIARINKVKKNMNGIKIDVKK